MYNENKCYMRIMRINDEREEAKRWKEKHAAMLEITLLNYRNLHKFFYKTRGKWKPHTFI